MKKYAFLFLLLLCGKVLGATPTQVNGIWYVFDDNTQTASVVNKEYPNGILKDCYSGSIAIPASVTFNNKIYSVTSISALAFARSTTLTSVQIPNSVTSIGGSAFGDCTGLTSFSLPNSVTHLEGGAFTGSGLTSPIYNARIFAYLPPTFSGHYSIPDGIETIAYWAFHGCDSLTSITIPNSITNIEGSIDCNNVSKVYYTGSIQDWCLKNWGGDMLPSGYELYILEEKVTDLTIPNTISTIKDMAFYGCGSLTSVTIGNSVTNIGIGAFKNCSGLTSVTIGNSVTSIGDRAFDNCNIKNVYYTGNMAEWCSKAWNTPFEYLYDLYIQSTKITDLSTIPNSITSICDGAFKRCGSLTSVTIPNSVTSIGSSAFAGCRNITSINNFHEQITNVGAAPFYDSGIKYPIYNSQIFAYIPRSDTSSYSIPEGITIIADRVFSQCSLSSLTIPSSVTSMPNIGGPCRMRTIICKVVVPPQLESFFYSETVLKIDPFTVYVPDESVQAYKNAKLWQLCNILPMSALPQSLENPSVTEEKSIKVMENGHIYIKRGDKTYTITGAEL